LTLLAVAEFYAAGGWVFADAGRNETPVENQFFTETSLPTFPYRYKGAMRE
jgi:hypothetical protein